jgi:hypothetical protein
MSAEVKSIFGGPSPLEPVDGVIEDLERLLAEAKAGTLVAFAYVSVKRDEVLGTGWAGGHGTRHLLGSGVGMLHHRYTACLLERTDDPET